MKTKIVTGIVGSHAYGYATENSDTDLMEVYINPIESYFGIFRNSNSSQSVSEETDITKYEYLNFVGMCIKFNPNVVPLLFLPDNLYTFVSDEFEILRRNKESFISQRAFDSLSRYGVSQRKKAFDQVTGKMGAKRKQYVCQYEYDIEHAAHTHRLLKMALHLIKTGEVSLTKDWEFSLKIRQGLVTKEQIDAILDADLCEFDYLCERYDGPIPKEPDMNKINSICVNTLREFFIT